VTDDQPTAFLADLSRSVLDDVAPPNLTEDLDRAARRAWSGVLESTATAVLADRIENTGLGTTLAAATDRAVQQLLTADPAAQLEFPNSAQWLTAYLLPNYVRRLGDARWCRQWWEHAEALTRIEALWRSWEAMRWDGPTGMAVWWRDYADPHMRVLTATDGPFFDCQRGHKVADPFPTDPPPEGLF
jgi:hypothetical protein